MMSEQASERPQWEKSMGLAEGKTQISLTCSKEERDLWKQEAARNGYSSRSKYLYDLIQEARSIRQMGFLGAHKAPDRIEELEAQVRELERQLAAEREQTPGRLDIDDPEIIRQALSDQHRSLPEILKTVVESGALDETIRKPVEDQLYFLASQGRVEYEPGFGWKLSEPEA